MSTAPSVESASDGGILEVPYPEEDKNLVIEPMSANYQVDYIMDVKVESKYGTDIPLYNEHIKARKGEYPGQLYLEKAQGRASEHFDDKTEDYWLFCLHLNDAEMEIAIGGESPVLVNSRPNWSSIPSSGGNAIRVQTQEKNWGQFDLKFNFQHNRYVAVRCPKMSNPAITVRATGHYGAILWVGLFVKSATDNNNQFVAVKTTNRLLPKYAERIFTYPGYQNWFEWDGPVDVHKRTLTLFPKQLYGTTGNLAETYDKYVTTDPTNKIGDIHLKMVREKVQKGLSQKAFKYTWNTDGKTIIEVSEVRYDIPNVPRGRGYHPPPRWRMYLDYATGTTMVKEDKSGMVMLLVIFETLAGVAGGLLSGKAAEVVSTLLAIPGKFSEEELKKEANMTGFITAMAKVWDAHKDREEKKKKLNTGSVELISKREYPFDSDFGAD